MSRRECKRRHSAPALRAKARESGEEAYQLPDQRVAGPPPGSSGGCRYSVQHILVHEHCPAPLGPHHHANIRLQSSQECLYAFLHAVSGHVCCGMTDLQHLPPKNFAYTSIHICTFSVTRSYDIAQIRLPCAAQRMDGGDTLSCSYDCNPSAEKCTGAWPVDTIGS